MEEAWRGVDELRKVIASGVHPVIRLRLPLATRRLRQRGVHPRRVGATGDAGASAREACSGVRGTSSRRQTSAVSK